MEAAADGVDDRFEVRWAPAAALGFRPVGHDLLEVEAAIVRGVASRIPVVLLDADGRALGYTPDQIEVRGPGVGFDDDGPVVTQLEDGWLVVGFSGHAEALALTVVDPEEVELELIEGVRDGACVLNAVGWAGELPVLDPGPVRWSHVDTVGRDAPCAEGVTASL